ncbi:uncharacterized protein LOC110071323 isoform X1 [Pogona vitticeps]
MMGKLRGSVMPTDPLSDTGLLCQACGFLLIDPQQAECGHRYCGGCVKGLFSSIMTKPRRTSHTSCACLDCVGTGTFKSYQEHTCLPVAH